MKKTKYTFKIHAGKKIYERTHHCDSIETAKAEARGMVYALFFLYKHPWVEIFYKIDDNKHGWEVIK